MIRLMLRLLLVAGIWDLAGLLIRFERSRFGRLIRRYTLGYRKGRHRLGDILDPRRPRGTADYAEMQLQRAAAGGW